jgi:trehalose/maltose hydrolase-like predicted phosphorylase
MVDRGDCMEFAPRLPAVWKSVTFYLTRHGSRVRVALDHGGCTLTLTDGLGVPVGVGDQIHVVTAGEPLRIDR